MEMVPLTATARAKETAATLRRKGQVPCVLYGNEVQNSPLQCVYNDLFKAYVKAGESTLVELDAGGKKVPVLFHAVQFDVVSNRIAHVDFYAVNLKKEIEAHVPIHFEGESLAVKELAAIFVAVQDHVVVRCLPTALPHHIPVSLEKLAKIHDSILVSDLKMPAGVTVKDDPTAVIATVQEQRKEEEIAPPVAGVPAEGEAAAPAEGEAAAPAEGEAPAKEEKKGGKKEKD
ncbi:MAG: 50S ribosomal protein L25 [Candidatus Peribacteraceae bacterium]|nr:50S ribosomal protein L25 [Candidatus Peribacteraceae bacterium]